MSLHTQYACHPEDAKHYDTHRLREAFHAECLMRPQEVRWVYTHYDRFLYGGIMPVAGALSLDTLDPLKSEYFLERRELGILNVGDEGVVEADGQTYTLHPYECMYLGRGTRNVSFRSQNPTHPAKFYLNSTPAHKSYPTVHARRADANRVELGETISANQRVLYQYIHEEGIQSCQLVMGYTEVLRGNIWNTFPPHTHERRMEVYFYFDIPEGHMVMHFMGQPQETRHLAMHNYDAVVSPPWSIHAGAGTQAYKFAWGMGGENQSFADMDAVSLLEVR